MIYDSIDKLMKKMERLNLKNGELLDKVSKKSLSNVKKRYGHYQEDVKWPALKDATVARKAKGDTPLLETGELRDSNRITKKDNIEVFVGSNLPKASYMEFGVVSQNVPARPVYRPEARKAEQTYGQDIVEAHIEKVLKQSL